MLLIAWSIADVILDELKLQLFYFRQMEAIVALIDNILRNEQHLLITNPWGKAKIELNNTCFINLTRVSLQSKFKTLILRRI